jgi:hypothetical protein
MITPAAVLSSILPSSGATLLEPTALNGLMSGDTITQKMRFMPLALSLKRKQQQSK